MKISQIAWRNINRNLRRSILSGSAIAIATFSIIFVFALIAGVKDDMGYNLATYITGNVRVRHVDYDKYEHLNPTHLQVENYNEFISDIEGLEGVTGVAPRINFPSMIKKNDPVFKKITALGFNIAQGDRYFSDLVGRLPKDGKKEIVVDKEFAETHNLKEGDLIDFLTRRTDGGTKPFIAQVVGIAVFDKTDSSDHIIALPNTILDKVKGFDTDRSDGSMFFYAKIALVQDSFPAMGMAGDLEIEKEYQGIEERVEGALPQEGKNEILLGAGLAKEIGVSIGDKVTLLTQKNSVTFTVSGLAVFPYGGLTNKYFVLPIDRAQKMQKMPGAAMELLIKTGLNVDTEAIAEQVNDIFKAKEIGVIEAKSWTKIPTVYSFIGIAEAIYGVFGFVFFALGSSVIVNTTMMVIFERMKEIGTISAMGMTGKEIVKLFFLEAVYIGVIGAFVGTLLGVIGLLPMHFRIVGLDFTEAMEGIDFEMGGIMYPRLDGLTVIFIFIYSSIVAALTTLIPTQRAAKINPVDALRAN